MHFLNINSSSPGVVLKVAGIDASRGLISVFYLKDPTDSQWKNDPAMKEWLVFMKKYFPEGNADDANNVYATLAAQTMVHVLKQSGNDLSRDNVLKQAASIKGLSLPLFIPGIKVETTPADYHPIQQMMLVKFDGERWAPFGELMDVRKK